MTPEYSRYDANFCNIWLFLGQKYSRYDGGFYKNLGGFLTKFKNWRWLNPKCQSLLYGQISRNRVLKIDQGLL